MSAGRWQQIEQLFHQALEMPPDARPAFLDKTCGGDAELRRKLELLLVEEKEEGNTFAGPLGSVSANSLSAGDRLGPYEITEFIGAGGMGEVYRAIDTKLGREVAIKVLSAEFAGDADRMARFAREAKVLAALNHPHIAQIYGLEERAIIMEWVPGAALRAPLPIATALEYAKQIAEALEIVHEKGIIHRDLKPANILVTPEGVIKLLDFGLAATAHAALPDGDPVSSPTITMRGAQRGVIMGTAAYMSPEQAAGNPVDKRADIWSFGVVLWEMLTGQRLFRGETITHTLGEVLAAPIDFENLPRDTPQSIRVLLRRCLERNVKNRLRDIGEARVAIESTLAGEANGPIKPVERVVHKSYQTWLGWGTAALMVLVLGPLTFLHFREKPQATRRFVVPIPESQAFVDVPGFTVFPVGDGSAIVYTGRGPHGKQIYYRRLDRFEGTALPGTDNVACCLAVSPSGEWVAYEGGVPRGVYKVSVRGGPPVRLADVALPAGIYWGADDFIYSAEGAGGLFRVSPNGGSQRVAAMNKPNGQWFIPVVSPDATTAWVFAWKSRGATLASIRLRDGQVTELNMDAENPVGILDGFLLFGRADGTLGALALQSIRGQAPGAAIPVLDLPAHRNSGVEAALSPAGDLVYVKGKAGSGLTFLDTKTNITTPGPGDRELAMGPRLSPDGRQVAVAEWTVNARRSDLWLYDVASGARKPLVTGVDAGAPEWAPDGRRVVYRLQPDNGLAEAWWVPVDRSSPPERLLSMSIPIVRTVFSPDSRYAVVTATNPKTKRDLYLVDLKGERTPKPLETSAADESGPAVSPDGRWLAYVSDETGVEQVYVRPFPGGGAHSQISVDSGIDPHWEPDSRGIVYRGREYRGRELDRGGVRQVLFIKARLAFGEGISVSQRFLPFSGLYNSFDLGKDGRILALRPNAADAEIVVVQNWIAELKATLAHK